jgi:hypothetical protein
MIGYRKRGRRRNEFSVFFLKKEKKKRQGSLSHQAWIG